MHVGRALHLMLRPSPLQRRRLAMRRAGEGEFDLPSTNCATNERIPRRPHSFIRDPIRGRKLTDASPPPSPLQRLQIAAHRAGRGSLTFHPRIVPRINEEGVQGAMHVGRALHLMGMGLPSTNCATNKRIPRRAHSFIRDLIRGRGRRRGRERGRGRKLTARKGNPSTNYSTNERIPRRLYSLIRDPIRGRRRKPHTCGGKTRRYSRRRRPKLNNNPTGEWLAFK